MTTPTKTTNSRINNYHVERTSSSRRNPDDCKTTTSSSGYTGTGTATEKDRETRKPSGLSLARASSTSGAKDQEEALTNTNDHDDITPEQVPSFSWLEESLQAPKPVFYLPKHSSTPSETPNPDPARNQPTASWHHSRAPLTSSPMPTSRTADPSRKVSAPAHSSSAQAAGDDITLRDAGYSSSFLLSRPSSLVETSCTGRDLEIRSAFEKAEASLSQSMTAATDGRRINSAMLTALQRNSPSHNRMSSLDSTTSEESSIPTPHCHGSVSSLLAGQASNLKDNYGSITSLASSTSLISPQVGNR